MLRVSKVEKYGEILVVDSIKNAPAVTRTAMIGNTGANFREKETVKAKESLTAVAFKNIALLTRRQEWKTAWKPV
jgi:hypothetical protein